MPERKIQYETVSNKADTGLLVRAPSWERLYIDAALSLTDMMVPLNRIDTKERRGLTVIGEGRDGLMLQWLNAVVQLFANEKFLAHRIIFESFDGKKIKAALTGDKFDSVRHGGVTLIKRVKPEHLELSDATSPEPHFYARIFLET